jgi:transposase
MTQRDRDRLVVLKKAAKRLITRRQAATEMDVSERQVRRMLRKLKKQGDQAVLHGLRRRRSNRRFSEERRAEVTGILAQEVYRGFGPTLASEYLAKKHGLEMGREAVRQLMMGAGLWRSRRQKVEAVHVWRERRSCRGELLQWDTSTHEWLEGRGERMYLIHMIDDASSELTARFVRSDSTAENMRLLWAYLEHNGRPGAFYTDKASLFRTAPKVPRDQKQLPRDERAPLPPTQIGRALQELGIVWIAAHSPQAKGRVERSFSTAQDRLVKGLRVAGAKTMEEANRYLEQEFLPWWNQHLTVAPANPTDAHRRLGPEHHLAASLSRVETRQVDSDYTIRLDAKIYRVAPPRHGLRGDHVRVEVRLDGSLAVRHREQYLSVTECVPRPQAIAGVSPLAAHPAPRRSRQARKPSAASRAGLSALLRKPGLPLWKAAGINRTRTPDGMD